MAKSSEFSFRFQSFWLAHQLQLRRWWVILIIATEALVFVTALVTLLLLWVDNPVIDRRLAKSANDLTPGVGLVSRQPQPVTFSPATINQIGAGRVDVFVAAKNPNPRWVVSRLRYRLRLGDTVTAERDTMFLPDSERYLTALSETVSSPTTLKPSDIDVEVVSTDWRFMKDETIYNQAKFTTSDVQFTPVRVAAGDATRLTFKLNTTGAFTFRTVSLQIVVLDGTKPLAFATQTVSNIGPTSSALIEVSWLGTLPSNARLLALPALDPTDASIVVK
jgi:hypothetical protein